jgi:hypothetical protein
MIREGVRSKDERRLMRYQILPNEAREQILDRFLVGHSIKKVTTFSLDSG